MHVLCSTLKNIMGLSTKTEIISTFNCTHGGLPIRQTLEVLHQTQHTIPMQVEKTTIVGFINQTIKQKASKAINMPLYWAQDRDK